MAAGEGTAIAEGPGWTGAALNGPGGWRLRGRIPWLLGFLMLFDSWDATVIAYTLPSISAEWGLSGLEAGWLASAGYAGAFVGAVLFGTLAERLGRLPVMRWLVIAMAVLALACSQAPGFASLVAIRLVQGLAIGGAMPVTISYVNEISPTATRGRFFGTFQFLMLAGFGLASLTSVWIVPLLGWRWMYGLAGIPLLFAPLLWLLPESPRWLAAKGRHGEALAALRRLGSEIGEIPADTATPAAAPRVPFAELLAPRWRGRTVTAAAMWFLTSLVSFGLLTWVPSIYVSTFDIPIEKALSYNAIVSIAVFVLPVVLRQTVDRIGRRPPPIIGTLLGGIALLGLLAVPSSQWVLIVALVMLGQIGVSVSSMVLWPWSAEIYDTRVRSVALGALSSLARAASMLTPVLVGGVMQATGSARLVFLAFGIASLAVALLWWRAAQETAGREMGA